MLRVEGSAPKNRFSLNAQPTTLNLFGCYSRVRRQPCTRSAFHIQFLFVRRNRLVEQPRLRYSSRWSHAQDMRIASLLAVSVLLLVTALASDVREFDLRTIERLGAELTQKSQQRDRGASTPAKKLARETAIAALKGRMFNIRYDYVVLDDPEGSGFLVYALGQGSRSGDVVVAGHFRVTVSADGAKAERVDALSRSVVVQNRSVTDLPRGVQKTAFYLVTMVGTKPSETLIYASNVLHLSAAIGTTQSHKIWFIENGKIAKSEPMK